MQLDLFAHSRDIMLRSDVVEALRRRESAAADKALAALSDEFPNDHLLTPLTELLSVLDSRPARFATHGEALEAVERMEGVVTPAAERVFDATQLGDWLIPVWRSLATSAEHLPFESDRMRAHAAYMLLKALDWTAAETSIARIPSWWRIPAALAWMAEARFGRAGLEDAWPLLIELAWIDSGLFGDLARRLPDNRLHALLRRFSVDLEGSGDESDLAWFPAWLLIAEPSFLAIFRGTRKHGNTYPEVCARVVMELLITERRGAQNMNSEYRRRLQSLHAGLFARYKATR